MRRPNFLIIGAAKSGTTALYHYLSQHPDVYMTPLKEPHFFSFAGETLDFRGPDGQEAQINGTAVTSWDDYLSLFDDVAGETAIGEASTTYLYIPKACERIAEHLPEAKLMAILRNPVDRAYSSYMHLCRAGREPLEFRDALGAEDERIRENWGFLWRYRDMGFYADQIKRYLERFDHDQIRIYLYDDLRQAPVDMIQDAFAFLGVDPSFEPDLNRKYNVSGVPRSELAQALIKKPNPVKRLTQRLLSQSSRKALAMLIQNRNLTKPELPTEDREMLIEIFRDDVERLQELLGRDLSHWLRVPSSAARSS